ncbi:GTP-binding protein [Rhizobium sp. CFBP 8762]|uniref:CobW family GTP-binding protein n=1 Tax=Rhizobium sp. CFBP 8762 TaxID=2775279 RepID=UPI00177FB228|nr:GTP-binding protein [Rhizobium sp. CFBP 8762]MBD8555586.1 GTP-binding protein [Rhizobium sp. CFBP 8762]
MSLRFASVPVSILTGFLGAGKTTLLNRLLKDPDLADTAVIINEFGDVSIDHLLVETASDGIIELSDGCLCCTVRGELVDTLADLMDRMQTGKIKPLQRVIVETTGLADPAPVLQSVIGNPVISDCYRLDGVVTVVDAVNGFATLDRHAEAVRQVAVADRIVLTKQTLANAEAVAALTARLAQLNPRAPLIDGDSAQAGSATLFDCGLYDPSTKTADVSRWLQDEDDYEQHHHHHGHHHHDVNRHDGNIRSFSIVHDKPIEPMALDMFIDLLRSAHGEKLLRMKAIVALTDKPDSPMILHGVQTIFHTPQRLGAWPDASDKRTRMVLITQDLPETFVRDLFDAFTGKPRIDRPDRAALEDNPLAVPGMKF